MIDTISIHEKLCAFAKEAAVYRVLEHEAEGRTEFITQIHFHEDGRLFSYRQPAGCEDRLALIDSSFAFEKG